MLSTSSCSLFSIPEPSYKDIRYPDSNTPYYFVYYSYSRVVREFWPEGVTPELLGERASTRSERIDLFQAAMGTAVKQYLVHYKLVPSECRKGVTIQGSAVGEGSDYGWSSFLCEE